MNIGLVVNARGKICMVHDEPFEGVPLWVGYHIELRVLEVIFEAGGTFPIDWKATDEMHNYLLRISKILIIRMENRQPVEGFDTSLLQLYKGKVLDAFEDNAQQEGRDSALPKFCVFSELL